MKDGGWIFISHSHQDIKLVRKIRNHLESLGFEPLLFYLKCLSDENEIEDLIKREIEEREWFIYAESANAQASKWVKTEREYIEKFTGKKIFTINLNNDLNEQLKMIEHIVRQMKVFISYSHQDSSLKQLIQNKLLAKDMLVYADEELLIASIPWFDNTFNHIVDASKNVFFIALITENSIKCKHQQREIEVALKSGGIIIPVYVGNVMLPANLMLLIGHIVGIRLSDNYCESDIDQIVDRILKEVVININ